MGSDRNAPDTGAGDDGKVHSVDERPPLEGGEDQAHTDAVTRQVANQLQDWKQAQKLLVASERRTRTNNRGEEMRGEARKL